MRTIYCYCKAFLINMLLMPLVMIFFPFKRPIKQRMFARYCQNLQLFELRERSNRT